MMTRTIIKMLSVFQAVLLAFFFILYNFYHIKNSSLNKQLGYQNYCLSKNYPSICKEEKFSNYLILYYDGLAHFFVKEFLLKQPITKKKYFKLEKILPKGIADSSPSFYTYFSGKLPFNYDSFLTNEDNLFYQLKKNNLEPKTYIYEGMFDTMDQSYEYKNDFERRGLFYIMSDNLNEWYSTLFRNTKYDDERVVDGLIRDRKKALEFIFKEYKKYKKVLDRKRDKIFKDFDDFFEKDKRFFIYIPKIDNFSHLTSIENKRYLKAVAMIWSNLNIIREYIDKKIPDLLLITMSDHGGDESPFQQERYNHDTPLNKNGNNAHLLFYSKKLKNDIFKKDFIYSEEVSGVLSSFISKINSVGEFGINYELFKKKNMKINYYKQFEIRLNHYSNTIFGELIDSRNLLGIFGEEIPSNKYLEKENNDFSQKDIKDYKNYLQIYSNNLKNSIRNKNNFFPNIGSIYLIVLILLTYCLPFLYVIKTNESLSKYWNYTFLILLSIFLIFLSDVSEKVIEIFFWIFIVFSIYLTKDQNKRKIFISLFILIITIVVFHFFALKFEIIFFNIKNINGLLFTYLVASILFFYFFKNLLANRNILSLISISLSLIMFLLNLFYDYLLYFQIAFDPNPIMKVFVNSFNYLIISFLVITLLQKKNNIKYSFYSFLINFSFWIETIYPRIVVLLLIIYFLKIQPKLKNLENFEKQNYLVCIFLSSFIIYFQSGYKFDWRNKIRLLHKFNMLGLYRPLYHFVITSFIAINTYNKKSEKSKEHQKKNKNSFFDIFANTLGTSFVFGCLFISIVYNFSNEYRMACGKSLETLAIVYGVFFYQKLTYYISYLIYKDSDSDDNPFKKVEMI